MTNQNQIQTPDKLEILQGAHLQHGPLNDRVYLMKLREADPRFVVETVQRRMETHDYGKAFARLPVDRINEFLAAGYKEEARIPGFYPDGRDQVFLGWFRDSERSQDPQAELVETIRRESIERQRNAADPVIPDGVILRKATPADVQGMAVVYREVFASYPFPIHDPEWLLETMASHVHYFLAEENGQILAVSSAETDPLLKTSEMTDFATLPVTRGRGFASRLLSIMEVEMQALNYRLFFTIARAVSRGMNFTFARSGYQFGGTLCLNTQISGQLESMNIWYKTVQTA